MEAITTSVFPGRPELSGQGGGVGWTIRALVPALDPVIVDVFYVAVIS